MRSPAIVLVFLLGTAAVASAADPQALPRGVPTVTPHTLIDAAPASDNADTPFDSLLCTFTPDSARLVVVNAVARRFPGAALTAEEEWLVLPVVEKVWNFDLKTRKNESKVDLTGKGAIRPTLSRTGDLVAYWRVLEKKAPPQLTVMDTTSGLVKWRATGLKAKAPPTRVQFTPNDKYLLAQLPGEKLIRVWDVATGKEVGQVKRIDADAMPGVVSDDEKTLVVLTETTVEVYDLPDGKERATHKTTGLSKDYRSWKRSSWIPAGQIAATIEAIRISPDGTQLVFPTGIRGVPQAVQPGVPPAVLLDLKTGKPAWPAGVTDPTGALFSADNKTVTVFTAGRSEEVPPDPKAEAQGLPSLFPGPFRPVFFVVGTGLSWFQTRSLLAPESVFWAALYSGDLPRVGGLIATFGGRKPTFKVTPGRALTLDRGTGKRLSDHAAPTDIVDGRSAWGNAAVFRAAEFGLPTDDLVVFNPTTANSWRLTAKAVPELFGAIGQVAPVATLAAISPDGTHLVTVGRPLKDGRLKSPLGKPTLDLKLYDIDFPAKK